MKTEAILRILVLASALVIAGCNTTSNTTFTGPSGAEIRKTKCSRSPDACYQEASKICQGPYQVVESESHAGGLAADLIPGPVTWYGMSYTCGPSDGKLAAFPFRGQQYVPAPGPAITNCQRFGNSVSCQSY